MKTVGELMSGELLTVGPADSVRIARRTLISHGIHGLPVVDGQRLVGIVTSWDLLVEYPPDAPVADAMTDLVRTTEARTPADVAATQMVDNLILHLVVVDDRQQPVGIISSFDLLRALAPR